MENNHSSFGAFLDGMKRGEQIPKAYSLFHKLWGKAHDNPDYVKSEWFDQPDGYGSEKWFPNTIICPECHSDEEKEIELDDEIDELKMAIDDARYTLKHSQERLDEIYKTYRPSDY